MTASGQETHHRRVQLAARIGAIFAALDPRRGTAYRCWVQRGIHVAAPVGLALLFCLAIGPGLVIAAPSASCSICNKNLIENPGAERGKGAQGDDIVPIPSWQVDGSLTAARYAWSDGDLTATSPGPAHRGKNYFYGGPSAAVSTATQTITMPQGSAGLEAWLEGWLGGYADQGDSATLKVEFLDSSGQVLSTLTTAPQITEKQRNQTSELLPAGASGKVPTNTTTAKVILRMTRREGSDNDGLADNLSLELTQGGKTASDDWTAPAA
jgi:hypothetical protein